MIKLALKYTKLKKEIIKYLNDKGLYEDIDISLIDQLVFNVYLADEAQENIKANGILVNVRKDESNPLMQVNQAVSVYHQSTKLIGVLCTKLSISPEARKKLKLVSTAVGLFESEFGDE